MSPLLILVIDSMTIKICYLVKDTIFYNFAYTVYKLKTDIYRHNYKQHLQRMSLLIWFINFANVICEPYFFYLKKKIIINKNKKEKKKEEWNVKTCQSNCSFHNKDLSDSRTRSVICRFDWWAAISFLFLSE